MPGPLLRGAQLVAEPEEHEDSAAAEGGDQDRHEEGNDGRSLRAILADVNGTLRGWYGYFQHRNANVFAAVNGCMRRRLCGAG